MSHDKWEDKKIEDLLRKVPKIHDPRPKEDIFNRLKEEGLFDDEPLRTNPQTTIQKRRFNWIPIVISMAAVCLLAILVPFLMKNDATETSEEAKSMEAATEAMDKQEMGIAESAAEEEMRSLNKVGDDLRTAVYPEELEGNTVFRLGLASDAADSIPVTVLIPNDRIQQDFGDITPSGVELYNQYAPIFNESAIGFMEYHPYTGEISELGEQVIHTLPSNQTYDMASGSLTTYMASLVDTFRYSYEEAELLNEKGSAFVFSEVGEPSGPIALKGETTQYNYFRYTQTDGTTYLTPNFRNSFSNVEEAILAMKEETNDIYQSVILPDADFEISVENQVVIVNFVDVMDLNHVDQAQAMQMIEGILLTAANFNMSVQFENIVQTVWQGFDFTGTLPMPLGPNEIPYATVFQQ